MSVPVEMDRLEKELRVLDMNEDTKNKEQGRGMKPWRTNVEEKQESGERFEIEDDWDAYESDWSFINKQYVTINWRNNSKIETKK